jgi:CHRD domain
LTYDDSTKILRWTITYWGLTGKTTSAHFHGPAKEGENAGTMITISPLPSPMKGAAILTEDQAKALLSGTMYVDVHSAKYPDGEIRGQIAPAS